MKQESAPAWTQEAYRPPRSKCSLCCSVSWQREGYPIHPGWEDGYPIQSWFGDTTTQSWWGTHPVLTWDLTWRGIPHPVLGGGGVPGYLLSLTWDQTWDGIPSCLDLEMGAPPIQTWDRGTLPQSRPGIGYPPVLAWDGIPPVSRTGYPPPFSLQVKTDWKYYLPSSFGCGQ